MSKIVIFPGSFSPFTLGHQSIVDRALPLFDKIIISIGVIADKNEYFSIDEICCNCFRRKNIRIISSYN